MSNESEELKNLLLKEELDTLELLKSKLLDDAQFTTEVSTILANAINQSQTKDQELELALQQPIDNGISRAFAENKQVMIDSILPIMGKLIRKTVANSIKQFVTDINRTLELGFSSKALKWRWQAFKSNQSFAEIVYKNTIQYQIQEIFLIHKETGLLIEHAGTQELLKNRDAISAMLTVIQDYIGDSLNLSESELQSAEVGDNTIWITSGPHAYLATVVKGNPTNRLKETLQKLIEFIHAKYSDHLISQNQFGDIPPLHSTLKENLVQKSIDTPEKKINWWPWIIGAVLIFGFISWKLYKDYDTRKFITNFTANTPGVMLQSITKSSGEYHVNLMKDPLANISKLVEHENIQANFKPFISLDPEIINLRVKSKIKNAPELTSSFTNGHVDLKGWVQHDQVDKIINDINQIEGVKTISKNFNVDLSQKIIKEINLCCTSDSSDFEFNIEKNQLNFNGEIEYLNLENIKQVLNSKFPNSNANFENLQVTDSNNVIINQIMNTEINLAQANQDISALPSFKNLVENLQTLNNRNANLTIDIKGFSDCNSNNSDDYSEKRASTIASLLIEKGISPEMIQTSIQSCTQINSNADLSQRNVKFNIQNN